MQIQSLTVGSWRNLEGIHIDVPLDAPLICLVGENGTGKSNLLELLSAVAARLGLSPGVQNNRGDPLGEPHDIAATPRRPNTFQAIAAPQTRAWADWG